MASAVGDAPALQWGMANHSSLKLAVSDLNAYRVVAREGSITHASRLLNTSQSALSRRMRKLEDKLQVCLFERGVHGVVPTESGRKLLRHVDSLCLHEEELIAELRGQHPLGLHGVLRVGASASMLRSVVVPALAPLVRGNRGAVLDFTCDEGARLDRLLAEARVDVVVTASPIARRGFIAARLGIEPHVLVESLGYRERDDVYLELAGDDASERYFAELPGSPARRCRVGDLPTLLRAVEHGVGRALVPAHAVDAGAHLRRVADAMPFACERHIHYAREARHARLVAAVVERLLASAADGLARDPAGLLDYSRYGEQPRSSA